MVNWSPLYELKKVHELVKQIKIDLTLLLYDVQKIWDKRNKEGNNNEEVFSSIIQLLITFTYFHRKNTCKLNSSSNYK